MVALIAAMYCADIGLTGSLETFSFQGLLLGNTWQPRRIVFGPETAGGRVGALCTVIFPVVLGVARAVTADFVAADADAEAVGEPESGLRVDPPAGVGIACAAGPLHAVTTTSEHTRALPSRRLGAFARSRITEVACPGCAL